MIGFIVWLCILAVVLYVVNTVIPGPAWIKTVINAVAIIMVLLWTLEFFGLYHTNFRSFR